VPIKKLYATHKVLNFVGLLFLTICQQALHFFALQQYNPSDFYSVYTHRKALKGALEVKNLNLKLLEDEKDSNEYHACGGPVFRLCCM
jgi:hypothetical protein